MVWERVHDLFGFEAIDGFRKGDGELVFDLGEFLLGPAHFAAAIGNEFAVEGGEEPRLDLGAVAQEMPLGRPDGEGLLRQVTGVRFVAGQAEGKAIEHGIKAIDDVFEIEGVHGIGPLPAPAFRPGADRGRDNPDNSAVRHPFYQARTTSALSISPGVR